jgi:2-phospho-L-lactate guanylyltransferase (CobY/MobA/RfbA family)
MKKTTDPSKPDPTYYPSPLEAEVKHLQHEVDELKHAAAIKEHDYPEKYTLVLSDLTLKEKEEIKAYLKATYPNIED